MPNYVLKADPSVVRLSADPTDLAPPITDWLEDPPSLVTLLTAGVPPKYFKLTAGGNDVGEQNPAEKTATDNAEDAALLAQSQADAKALFDHTRAGDPLVMRAIVSLLLEQLNVLRGAVIPPLPPLTAAQVRTAIRNKIDAEV